MREFANYFVTFLLCPEAWPDLTTPLKYHLLVQPVIVPFDRVYTTILFHLFLPVAKHHDSFTRFPRNLNAQSNLQSNRNLNAHKQMVQCLTAFDLLFPSRFIFYRNFYSDFVRRQLVIVRLINFHVIYYFNCFLSAYLSYSGFVYLKHECTGNTM